MDGTSMNAMNHEDITKRMGDYEILELLGAGGMGKVFKARNVISNRVEALKIILPDLAGRQDSAERFLREIQLLASLDHPNIASLRTAFTMDNQLVMAMEFVEGVTLSARLKKGPIPVKEAVGYIDQALNALGYAHARHIIHRDVKPANMMLTPEGVLKLMDFGIARVEDAPGMTKTGSSLGSLGYMSPEQIKGEPVDARSDLYSVAASLYEFVTGKSPFQGDNAYSIMTAQIKNDLTPPIEIQPDMPKVLSDTIMQGMATDPNNRFQSADAFRNALKHVLQDLQDYSDVADKTIFISGAAAASAFAEPDEKTVLAPKPAGIIGEPPTPPHTEKKPTNNRGLYIALGAVAIAAVLAMAFFSPVQRWFTELIPQTTKDDTSNAEPIAPPDPPDWQLTSVEPPESGVIEEQIEQKTPTPKSVDNKSKESNSIANNTGVSSKEPPPNAETVTPPPVPLSHDIESPGEDYPGKIPARHVNTAELENLEDQLDKLSSRAVAIRDSLDRFRKEQNAQGFGLRQDIAAASDRMTTNLDRAQRAFEVQDVENTRRYMKSAESAMETVERFSGRR